MRIKKKIDHKSAICYVVADVRGMTFDDLIDFTAEQHGGIWYACGWNVNHLYQPWIMLRDYNVTKPRELKFMFFFLDTVEEALDSVFEQCIDARDEESRRLNGPQVGNVGRLPWQ